MLQPAVVYFLDALASLDLKLSVSEWVSDLPFSASASTGLSDFSVQMRAQCKSNAAYLLCLIFGKVLWLLVPPF